MRKYKTSHISCSGPIMTPSVLDCLLTFSLSPEDSPKTTFNPSARSRGQSIESCISGPRKRIWRHKNRSNQMKGFNYNPLLLPRNGLKFPSLSRAFPPMHTRGPRAISQFLSPIRHILDTSRISKKGHRKERHANTENRGGKVMEDSPWSAAGAAVLPGKCPPA